MLFFLVFLNVLLIIGGWVAMQKLGGWTYLKYKMNNRGLSASYGHRVDLFNHLKLPDSCVVMLGNSLIAQAEWSELLGQKVFNRGISGDGTQGVLDRLEDITVAKPRQIFIMIGINDLISHSPPYILNNYRQLITRIQTETPQTKIYIQSLLPINNEVRNTGFQSKAIFAINEGLLALATEYQVPYINLHPILCDEKGQLKSALTSDGIHLNGAGYLLWAKELKKILI